MKHLLLSACCLVSCASLAQDPELENIVLVAKKNAERYAVLKKTVNRYDPAKTNVFARPARASMQAKLDAARSKASAYWRDYTNQVVKTTAYSNAMVVAQGIANAANAKIQDEISDLENKIEKYRDYQAKYPILKSIFAAMIADAENRIRILQNLSGDR